jgi:hypothetical protein
MTLHHLTFRAFCQATEDEARVAEALRFASGEDAKDINRERCIGYHGNPIVIMDIAVLKARMVKGVFLRLSEEDRAELQGTLEGRIDEDCAFYFRLDKQEAYLGRMVLGEKGEEHDVIAVHGKVKTYPKSREGAIEVMDAFLSSFRE